MTQASPLPSPEILEPIISAAPAPRRGTILLIEDRDDVRQGLAQLLELHGYVVADAADATRARGLLEADPAGFSVVVLDLMLPGSIGGREFRNWQLGHPELSRVPTIVITATDLKPAERMPLRPDAWLDKPFRFDDLLELIRRYVLPERSGIAPAQPPVA
jgi:DNA-binding response OmpR family regulator